MVEKIEDAIKFLESDNPTDRFSAACFFIQNPNELYREKILRQRRNELVKHVKMALDKAIANIDKTTDKSMLDIDSIDDGKIDKVRNNFLKAEAIDEFSGIILHELAPKIGILKTSAKLEIDNYEESEIKKNILSFDRIFKAIESLRMSASKPVIGEFDLVQLIRDIAAEENKQEVNVYYEGISPCIIKTDKNILSLAISNGIRNGLESIFLVNECEYPPELTICWGKSVEYSWITIIDEGIGLKGSSEDAYKIGSSNKNNHTGFGLPIIIQAIESLGGEVKLQNIETGGAKLDFKWVNL